ncbi:MarR family transcriptional regulator [Candidatus Pelagibacter sp.]|nr:MarR family transcriptional regulator [Candidatus Pelagibacter sp.]
MKKLPSISNEIDEDKIFKIINKNFSKIAPFYYELITSWLTRSYNVFKDIDKFIILIYFINKDLIFYRKNGFIINYDTFYKDKSIEIPKINISDISKDLKIPKESVRRKIQELEKSGVIKKTGKKIFLDRTAFITAKPEQTLREFSFLVKRLNELLVEEKITTKIFDVNAISKSIKDNFSFCWYQFYKFLFIYTNRWRSKVPDLETITVGFHVLLNTTGNKRFKIKDLNMKNWAKLSQGADDVGVNAMSLSEITGIPRPTVVRKIDYLKKNDWIHINNKKLISLNIKNKTLTVASKMQELNIKDLSKFLHRVFNQIKVINSN